MTHSHTDLKRHGALRLAALQPHLDEGNKTKKVKTFFSEDLGSCTRRSAGSGLKDSECDLSCRTLLLARVTLAVEALRNSSFPFTGHF